MGEARRRKVLGEGVPLPAQAEDMHPLVEAMFLIECMVEGLTAEFKRLCALGASRAPDEEDDEAPH